MPEQEELKLIVTLDDQASAKLASLKNQLANLESGSGGSTVFGKMGTESAAASRNIKGLQEGLSAMASRAGFIGGVVGGITSELAKMGVELFKEATNLQKLTAEVNNFSTAAARMGFSTTTLENNLRGFRAGGISIEAATRNLAGFSEAIADLSIVNGRLRGQLLSGGFMEIPKMFDLMQRFDVAKTIKEKMEIVKKGMDDVQERWTRLAGPEMGALMARRFREMYNLPDLDQYIARTREVGAAEEEVARQREDQAKRYQKNITDQAIGTERIVAAVSLMVYKLDDATGASKRLGEALNGIAALSEKLVQGEVTPPEVKGAIQDVFGKFGVGVPKPPGAPRMPLPPVTVDPFKFSGGAVQGGEWDSTNFTRSGKDWSWMRRSGDIVDRRDLDDNTEQTKSLTDEIKQLNDTLTGKAPPGSMAAGLGLNTLGGYATGGGGGGGGGFGLRSPSGAPYGNDAGPGIGPGAGQYPAGIGGQGATGGMVHGHPVIPMGNLPPGTKLYEPMTGTMGGGVGGSSAMFGPGMHEGVDIMGPEGSDVYASREGTVVSAPSPGGGRDQVLTIRHPDGTYSRYLHQRPGNVSVGDQVKGGQVVGKSGYRNAPHTHFEMWTGPPGARGSALMNPKILFGWNKEHPAVGGREITTGEGGGAVAGSDGDAKKVKGSWFGNAPGWRDPSEPVDSPKSNRPGIALRDKSTMGKMFEVTTPDGRKFILPQTDYGPAARTGRGIDITAAAGAQMGYTAKTFPTDAPFSYRQLDADGRRLDGNREMTVNGKGELNVNVSAPPGTRVSGSGEGLLKDTNIQQETQMEPASKGGDPATSPM